MGARRWTFPGTQVEILLQPGVEVRDFGDREPLIGIRFKYRGVACRELSLSCGNPKTAVSNASLAYAKLVTVRDEIQRGVFKYGEHFPESKRCALFGEVATKGVLCKKLFDEYELHAKATIDPATLLQYLGRLKRHIRPAWDKRPITMLTPEAITLWLKELAAPGEGRRRIVLNSARQIIVPFVAALDRAVKRGQLKANPFRSISISDEWPRELRKTDYEPYPFNSDERARIAASATRAWRLAFTVWSWGGYRPEEFTALKWSEIDFTNERVRVCRVLARLQGGSKVLERTKTESGTRYVPMIGPVKQALREMRELTGLKPHGFVFENANTGTRWSGPDAPRRTWAAMLKRAGVPYRSIKQLRHTFASMMLKNGEAIETVSKILGHKHSGITRQFYARMIEEITATNKHGFALRGDYSKAVA